VEGEITVSSEQRSFIEGDGLLTFAMSCFRLPVGLCQDIKMGGFLSAKKWGWVRL